jgi:excisionase family DNA binding protein
VAVTADHLTVDQMASLLLVGRDTVLRAIAAGQLDATRDSDTGPWRINPTVAGQYFNAITITPEGQEPAPVTFVDTFVDLPQTKTLDEIAVQTGLSLRWLREGCRGKPPRLAHIRAGKAPRMTAQQAEAAIAKATRADSDTDEVQTELARRRRTNRGAA